MLDWSSAAMEASAGYRVLMGKLVMDSGSSRGT
jgi:hypothetical protein